MQRALRATSLGRDVRSGSGAAATRVNKFLIAGVAVAGAATIAVNPAMSNIATEVQHSAAAAEIQHRSVQLTSDISDVLGDYTNVVSQTGANLQALGSDAGVAIPALLQAIGANLSGYGSLIGTALTGAGTSLQNALYGGWYGGDDGYVFGLFGGTVTGAGVTESGSTLQEVFNALKQGNVFNAFSYLEEWSLEVLDHTLKPLLSPILNTAKAGAVATATIPGEILQTLSNVTSTMFTYSNLKALAETVMSPALSVAFGLLGDLSKIGSDVTSAKIGTAVADVLKVPADLVGDLLNGYVYVNATTNPTNQPFTGLLNSGSLLQDLLVTWPKQLATALGLAKSTTTAAATNATVSATVVNAVAATADSSDTATSSDAKTSTSDKKQNRHGKQAKGAGSTTTSGDIASSGSVASAASGAGSDSATTTSVKKQDHHGKTKLDTDTDSQATGSAKTTKAKHSDAKGSSASHTSHSSHSGAHGSTGSGGSGHK